MRQLSKEWRQRYLQHTTVAVSGDSSYLPAWAVLGVLPSLSSPQQQHELLAAMARRGDLSGLQLLARHQDVVGGLLCSDTVLCAAAGSGHADIVRWLVREQGCSALRNSSGATASAAAGAHVHVLQELRRPDCMFAWNSRTNAAAAGGGHLATLRWLHSHGCPHRGGVCRAAAAAGHQQVLEYLRASEPLHWRWWVAVHAACTSGHLHVVRWARAAGYAWEPEDHLLCCGAASDGQLRVLAYLMEQGCPIGTAGDLVAAAAGAGKREVLLWLRAHGHAWTADTFVDAAGRGDVALLRWLRQQAPPCPWDSSAIVHLSCVARRKPQGAVECLEYMLSSGCPWDAEAYHAVRQRPELRGVHFPGVRRSQSS